MQTSPWLALQADLDGTTNSGPFKRYRQSVGLTAFFEVFALYVWLSKIGRANISFSSAQMSHDISPEDR